MNTTTNDRKAGVEVMDKAMGMYSLTFTQDQASDRYGQLNAGGLK